MKQQVYIHPFMESASHLPPSYPFDPRNNQQVLIEERQDLHNLYKCQKTTKKDMEYQRRTFKALQTFIDKYVPSSHSKMIADLKEKAIRLRREEMWSKGVRQCAGVVVFMAVRQDLGISLRQFCKRNNLSLRLFHKHSKTYYKLYYQNEVQQVDLSAINEPSASIKVQYKGQQDKILEMEDSVRFDIILQEEEPEYIIIQNDLSSRKAKEQQQSRKAIECIFADLFKGQYFHRNREVLIENLVAKIVPIDHIYKQVAVSQVSLIYYLILAVIKHLGFRINFARFNAIVQRKTAESINKRQAQQIIKMYTISQANRREAESPQDSQRSQLMNVGNVKEEEFNWQAGSFKMVESPMVMQQEYFSFENCYFFPPESHSYQ